MLFFVHRLSFLSSCCACLTLEGFALRKLRKFSKLLEKRAWVFTLTFQKFSWKFQSSLINDDASQTGVVCIMSRWQAALSHTHSKTKTFQIVHRWTSSVFSCASSQPVEIENHHQFICFKLSEIALVENLWAHNKHKQKVWKCKINKSFWS